MEIEPSLEPSNIQWENIGISYYDIFLRMIRNFILIIIFLIIVLSLFTYMKSKASSNYL